MSEWGMYNDMWISTFGYWQNKQTQKLEWHNFEKFEDLWTKHMGNTLFSTLVEVSSINVSSF